MVTVAALYPVAEAITQTGGLDFVMKYALGVPSGVHSMIRSFIRVTLLRVLLFTRTFLSLLSSFGDSHPSETFSHFSRSSALFTDRSKRDYSQSQLFFALLRLMLPCVALSAFINNTPEVAIMIPVVKVSDLICFTLREVRCSNALLSCFASREVEYSNALVICLLREVKYSNALITGLGEAMPHSRVEIAHSTVVRHNPWR